MSFEDIRGCAAGLVALLQVAVLPGWIAVSRFGLKSLVPNLLVVLSVSFITTFNLVLLLQFAGMYNRTALAAVAVGEVLLLMLCSRRVKEGVRAISFSHPAWPQGGFFVANIGALVMLSWVSMQMLIALWAHIPGIFEAWDAVVSWNRWANDWYAGRWPVETYGYPQLIPVTWSLSYLWLGNNEIEIFARALMGLFPIAMVVIFIDFFWRWRRPAPLVAAALLIVILLGPYVSVLDSGYVDIPVTFFVMLTGYLLYLAAQQGMPAERLLIFAAVTAAAAVHCKQSGFWGVVIFIAGVISLLVGKLQVVSARRRRTAGLAVAIFAVLVLPWFAMKWFNLISSSAETNVHYVTSLIYGNETLLQRLIRAVTVTLPTTLLPPVLAKNTAILSGFILLTVASLRSKLGRICLSVGIPYLIVWALFFSYDGRNLLPAVPFLCLAIGFGVEQVITWVGCGRPCGHVAGRRQHGGGRTSTYIRSSLQVLLVAVVLLVLWPVNAASLKQRCDDLRLRSGEPDLNRQLLELVSQPGFRGQFFTTYPQMISIPALRPYVFTNEWRLLPNETLLAIHSGQPFCEIMRTIPGSRDITHALMHTGLMPPQIDAAIAGGSLHPVITTPGFRLLRLNCTPELPASERTP